MADARTILVLGGGVGGIIAARALRRRLPRPHRIVLVERQERHVFAPSLLWLMVGLRGREAIERPVRRLGRKGIEVRIGEVERIEPETRRVTVSGETLEGDYVIVTLGAELAAELVTGLEGAGHDFYTVEGAEGLRTSLEGLRRGRVVVLTASPVYKCPAAPYEAALLIDAYCRRAGARDAVSIDLFAAEAAPMPVAGPAVSEAVRGLLAARDIPYHPGHVVESVDASRGRLTFANGAAADFDLLAYVPPHRAPRVVRESGLTAESGWIAVDRSTLATRFPGVYALGDVVSIPLKMGKPLPKAGVFAHRHAEVVARNIADEILGKPASARFDGFGECFVEVGGGKAAYGGGDFYAEPSPAVELRPPSRRSHLSKVLFEKSWLYFKF